MLLAGPVRGCPAKAPGRTCIAGGSDGVMAAKWAYSPPYPDPGRAPRAPAVAGVPSGPRGRALLRSPVWRGDGVGAGNGRAGAAGSRLHGGRRDAGDDVQVAARQRLLDPAGRDPRQRRLLAGGLLLLEERPRGARRRAPADRVAIIGQSRGGVLARAVAVRRPDLVSGIVDARRANRLDAQGPPARAAPGRPRRRARHRPRPGLFSMQLPARPVLRAVPRRSAGPFPDDVALRVRVLALGRNRRLARVPGPGGRRATSRSAPRTAGWRVRPPRS